METANKITLFNNNSVLNAINDFLDDKSDDAKNTSKNYRGHITEFFRVVCNKEVESLLWDDVLNIQYQDVKMYQRYLKDNKGHKASTINSKVSAIKALFKQSLVNYNNDINLNVVNVKKLKEEKNSWGTLSKEEVDKLISYAERRSHKARVQALFFETSFITAIRYKALLCITRDNLKRVKDHSSGKYVYTINVQDKRDSNVVKSIPNRIYDELMEIEDNGRIFNIDADTLRRTLKKFCQFHDIEDDRKIVLHSIKSASGGYVLDVTGSIEKAAKHLGHKDINTSYGHYIGKNNNLTDQASYKLFDRSYKIRDLEELSKEELLGLIDKAGETFIARLVELKESNIK